MGNSEVLTTAEIRKLNCEKIFAYIYQKIGRASCRERV